MELKSPPTPSENLRTLEGGQTVLPGLSQRAPARLGLRMLIVVLGAQEVSARHTTNQENFEHAEQPSGHQGSPPIEDFLGKAIRKNQINWRNVTGMNDKKFREELFKASADENKKKTFQQ